MNMVAPKAMTSLQTAFDGLQSGAAVGPFASLIKPFLHTDHGTHIDQIGAADEQVDTLFGVHIRTPKGIYRPHINSSSVLLLRAMIDQATIPVSCMLEIGTGSGAVGVWAIAAGIVRSAVLADIDPLAVSVAKMNVQDAKLDSCITVLQSDVFDAVPRGRKFDRVVFNLPLWHKSDCGEGEHALVDIGGMAARRFFAGADQYLLTGGEVWFSYSNLSDQNLLEEFSDKWHFCLTHGDYIAATGLFKFIYKATLRSAA